MHICLENEASRDIFSIKKWKLIKEKTTRRRDKKEKKESSREREVVVFVC